MELILYKNFSKRKNSTKRPPAAGTTFDVYLKQGTSIESPTFLIDGIDLDYTYAKWAGHYYFIDDITIGNNNIYEISCSQDVLATHKTEIGNYECYIERAASNYNNMIPDPALSAEQSIVNTSKADSHILPFSGLEGGCFVVKIAGAGYRGVTSFIMKDLQSIQPIFNKSAYIEEGFEDLDLQKLSIALVDPIKYLLTVKWCPLNYDNLTAYSYNASVIALKWYGINVTGVRALYDDAFLDRAGQLNLPAAFFNDFRDYHPSYSTYKIYFPGIGEINLAPDLLSTTLFVSSTVNLNTGEVMYSLRSKKDTGADTVVGTYSGNLYADVQLASYYSNAGTVINDIGGVVNGTVQALIGNVMGAASAVVSSISAFNNILMPQPSIIGTDSSSLSALLYTDISIYAARHNSGDIPLSIFGRPCCKNLKINTLTGFIKCGAASIPLDGLADDRDVINNYLNNGFYYE